MANYGFIYVDIPMYVAIGALSDAAQAIFGDRLRVRGVEGGVLVEAPGTGSADPEEAKRLWLPTGRDADMYVAHNPECAKRHCLAFRGGPEPKWWQWASGCVCEEVSDRLGLPIVYDATGEAVGPGDRHYRRGTTFREYMTACFGGTLAKSDEQFLRPHFDITPAAFLGAS